MYSEKDGYYYSITKKRYELLTEKLIKNNYKKIKFCGYDSQIYYLDPRKIKIKTNSSIIKMFPNKLNEFSNEIIGIKHRIENIVDIVYKECLDKLYIKYHNNFTKISEAIAKLDFLKSCAKVALINNYVKPIIENEDLDYSYIDVKNLRHPIIEILQKDEYFVPNDICIGDKNNEN